MDFRVKNQVEYNFVGKARSILEVTRSKVWVCGLSIARIVVSNPSAAMEFCL
jgi:hypothetical protein